MPNGDEITAAHQIATARSVDANKGDKISPIILKTGVEFLAEAVSGTALEATLSGIEMDLTTKAITPVSICAQLYEGYTLSFYTVPANACAFLVFTVNNAAGTAGTYTCGATVAVVEGAPV